MSQHLPAIKLDSAILSALEEVCKNPVLGRILADYTIANGLLIIPCDKISSENLKCFLDKGYITFVDDPSE